MQRYQLGHARPSSLCSLCGAAAALSSVLCDNCWEQRQAQADQRQRLLEALQERRRLGDAFGNKKAVLYPSGIEIGLRRLLDALRTHQIEVRVELINPFYVHSSRQYRDGHLRRVSDKASENAILYWPGSLGLFADPSDADPRDVLVEDDYNRIARIEVVDSLVIGTGAPRVVWGASAEKQDKWRLERQQQVHRERRMALLLVVHVAIIMVIVVVLLMPVVWNLLSGHPWIAMGWLVNWVILSFISGMTIIIWDAPPWPDLSLLFKDGQRHQPDDQH